jgi:uncharacterized surface protein with fasciclin (FAS1) repeats
MKKILFSLVMAGLVGGFFAPTALAYSDTKGRLLLQVEDKGQLWYITNDGKSKFYLGSPVDMFRLMRFQGVGISNSDLAKIPEAGKSQMGDKHFANMQKGKILLQVQQNGEAWYVHPMTGERHYLGTPQVGFNLFKSIAVGASNAHLSKIPEVKDIALTAIGAGSFNTLVAAVTAAGLVDVLQNGGPFTVFAPTDEAFAKLPAGTVEALLNDIDQLTKILTYHVVPGKVMAKDVVKLNTAPTVNGKNVSIKIVDGKVMVDGAQVTATDIMATNGVIHVIDSVILP